MSTHTQAQGKVITNLTKGEQATVGPKFMKKKTDLILHKNICIIILTIFVTFDMYNLHNIVY